MERSSGEPVRIFLSYSHADEQIKNDLLSHLAIIQRTGLATVWHDRRLTPGTPIDDAIARELAGSDVALLLVSSAFLQSDYCYSREMREALRLHAEGRIRVIPVVVRPCFWEPAPFSNLLALPTDGRPITSWADRDAAMMDVARGLHSVCISIREQRAAKRKQEPTARLGGRAPDSREKERIGGPYIYAALLLRAAGRILTESAIRGILTAAEFPVNEPRLKALLSSVNEEDIDKALAEEARKASAQR